MLEAITNQYMVLVKCLTFNQAAYIEDAMNGFCMQKTTFPFVCGIIDDASTDGEPDIIKNYLQLNFDLEDKSFVRNEETNDYVMTLARHKTNKNCSFVVFFLKYNHYQIHKPKAPYLNKLINSKYIAICEGDDYWIDPLKLQKQVFFLENNLSYNMVYTKYKERHNDIIKDGSWNLLEGNCLKPYLLRKGFIPTASVMFRNNFLFDLDYKNKNFPLGDVPIWIQLMHSGPIKLLPDVTTAYRILEGSASHPKNFLKGMLFDLGAHECRKYFSDKYGYKDISSILEKEINVIKLYIELYNGSILSFFKSKPWKYGIKPRTILAILKMRILNR